MLLLSENVCMCKKKNSVYIRFSIMWFQASTGSLGTYLLWISWGYFMYLLGLALWLCFLLPLFLLNVVFVFSLKFRWGSWRNYFCWVSVARQWIVRKLLKNWSLEVPNHHPGDLAAEHRKNYTLLIQILYRVLGIHCLISLSKNPVRMSLLFPFIQHCESEN